MQFILWTHTLHSGQDRGHPGQVLEEIDTVYGSIVDYCNHAITYFLAFLVAFPNLLHSVSWLVLHESNYLFTHQIYSKSE